MFKPGIMSVAVLLMLPACIIPALEISVNAVVLDDYAAVTGRVESFHTAELIRQLDSGGTARLTWVFRLGGLDETLTRYAHRDPMGTGYVIFTPEDGNPGVPVPLGGNSLLETFFSVEQYQLKALGPWEQTEVLECRLFLDSNMMIPPLSIKSLFGTGRDRSSWSSIAYPPAGSE
ncbi:MAG: hypothetical protein KAH21_06500 [Spirochaetaceae bacterium]|nr:hypothetical protein [Spirochaetaceae bacterium]